MMTWGDDKRGNAGGHITVMKSHSNDVGTSVDGNDSEPQFAVLFLHARVSFNNVASVLVNGSDFERMPEYRIAILIYWEHRASDGGASSEL